MITQSEEKTKQNLATVPCFDAVFSHKEPGMPGGIFQISIRNVLYMFIWKRAKRQHLEREGVGLPEKKKWNGICFINSLFVTLKWADQSPS